MKKYAFWCRTSVFILSAFTGIPGAIGQIQNSGSGGDGLEEIVVTAQRRTQSMQEVPISIETFSGETVQQQGFRDMVDVANYSPTVIVSPTVSSSDVRIRGFGSSGRTLSLEQAVPLFVDGIHYGRMSQIKTAFLDPGQIEILKGPQPVYFGQNAIAGAINITSAGPTPEWEGYTNASYGNGQDRKIEAAAGGPVTDTLGIRLAGKYEASDGHMKDILTQDNIGAYKNKGGRIILEWTPTEQFQATAKFEISKLDKDPEGSSICLVDGPLRHGPGGVTDPGDQGREASVWVDPPRGTGFDRQHEPLPTDCFKTDWGLATHYEEPPLYVRHEEMSTGMLDIVEAAMGNATTESETFSKYKDTTIFDYEILDAKTGYIDLKYQFANEIEVQSLTGYSQYLRNYVRGDNSNSPFFTNYQNREEDLHQYSQELRLTSPAGGTIEWMTGLYYQTEDLNAFSNSLRASTRRGQRFNTVWQDTEWKSAFATVTFNFFEDKASLDLGGRYSIVEKTGFAQGYGASWIFDVRPCAVTDDDYLGGGNFDPDTCPLHPRAVQVDPATDNPRIYVAGADMDNLWTIPYNAGRDVPSSWRGPRANAVGLTAPSYTLRGADSGPWLATLESKEFDPQVTLRYRPNQDHSLYARWAQSFKGGGFDSGLTSLVEDIADFAFGPEYSETYEVGAKGRLFDGRGRYDLTLFEVTFTDLQLTTAQPSIENASINVNAGEQRVRGIELNGQYAVTDRLVLGVSMALMDGKMTDFQNAGCTLYELQNAAQTGCDPVTETIDRSGSQAPYTPDYKVVLDMEYWMPVFEQYKLVFDAKGYISDEYITDVESFSRDTMWNKHGDLNLTAGVGDQEDKWLLSVYARNIFEARPSYNPEFAADPNGIAVTGLNSAAFFSYGLMFKYNLR